MLFLTPIPAPGFIHGTNWSLTSIPSNTVMAMTCLGVLSTVTHLRTFSNNRVLVNRESISGIGMLPYFLSQVGAGVYFC